MAGVQGQRPVQIVTDTGDSAMDDTNNAVRVNVVTGGGAGGTSATDESAYTPTSSTGTPVMGAVDEVAADDAAEGTLAILRSTVARALHVNLRDAAGAEVAVGGGTQYTEDAAAAANPVGTALIMVRADSLAGLTTTDGDNVAARGTDKGELYVKHADSMVVTATNLDVRDFSSASDSVAVLQATASNLNAQVVGTVAHDSGDSGNPVKIGYKAIAYGASPTAVTANDRTDAYANRHGVPFVIGGHPNILTRSAVVADADGAQTDASLVGTISAGTKVAVTEILVKASNANSVNVNVRVGFGTANVPTPALAGTAGLLLDEYAIPPGGGSGRGNGTAVIGIGADGAELRLTCGDPTGGHLTVTFSYFEIDS